MKRYKMQWAVWTKYSMISASRSVAPVGSLTTWLKSRESSGAHIIMLKKFDRGRSSRVWDINCNWRRNVDLSTRPQNNTMWVFPCEAPPVTLKRLKSVAKCWWRASSLSHQSISQLRWRDSNNKAPSRCCFNLPQYIVTLLPRPNNIAHGKEAWRWDHPYTYPLSD